MDRHGRIAILVPGVHQRLMAIMFIINALVVVYNVWLKRMGMRGEEEMADRIDAILDWAYPLAYLVSFGLVIWQYF